MHSQQHALGAGAAAPENGDVLRRATGQDVWDQESSNRTDSEGATPAAQACAARPKACPVVSSLEMERRRRENKRLTTLQAALARHGFALDPLSGSSLLLQRWGLTRVLADLDAAQRFLEQVGGTT